VRISRPFSCLLAGVLASLPSIAAAQVSGTCRPELVQTGGQGVYRDLGGGRIHQFASGGVLARCIGQATTIRADSVAWYAELNRMDFEGAVRFRDSTTQLDTDRARYFPNDERLEAYGAVHLEDENTKSVLSGENLTYYRVAPGVRDTSELFASRRPLVEYLDPNADRDEPYVIRGDRVRLKGEGRAWAAGRVTIERSDFSAAGDSAALDLDRGEGTIVGTASAEGRDTSPYVLKGSVIAFRMTDGDLSWVQAQDSGEALSTDWVALGDTIEFSIADDLIQQGNVWGVTRRPRVQSAEQTIVGDSLAIDAPDQVLSEIRGFGSAVATTVADTAGADADWISGDTLLARFDSTETGKRVIVMIRADGNARAYYHVFPPEGEVGPPAVNYARGRRITALFRDEELDRVDVVDQADGVYLEPIVRRPP
jgi:hypothetical protein